MQPAIAIRLAAHGCDASECIVFEDSFQGLEAGRRAGSRVIALATTNPAASLQGKADRIVNSLAELADDISRL